MQASLQAQALQAPDVQTEQAALPALIQQLTQQLATQPLPEDEPSAAGLQQQLQAQAAQLSSARQAMQLMQQLLNASAAGVPMTEVSTQAAAQPEGRPAATTMPQQAGARQPAVHAQAVPAETQAPQHPVQAMVEVGAFP